MQTEQINHTPQAVEVEKGSNTKSKARLEAEQDIERIEPPERAYLQARAIDIGVAAVFGVRTVGGRDEPWAPEHYGIKGWKTLPFPALCFPYPHTRELYGECVYRFRLRETEVHVDHTGDGCPDETKTYPRFLASSGIGAVPYVVAKAGALQDPSIPAFVLEGPAKALSWASALTTKAVCIGLGGVEAGAHDAAHRKETGEFRPHPLLTEVSKWKDRRVYIVMDAGRVINPFVARGEARTVQLFQQLGADVYIVPIPLHDGEDQGPDDWLARKVPTPAGQTAILNNQISLQRREVIHELLGSAVPADPAIRAAKVGSTEEARRLLADLPFQASLAINEEATSGLVVRALRQFGVDKPAMKAAVKAFHAAVRRKRQKEEPAWKSNLSRTQQGQLVAGAANVMAILRNDDGLHDKLAFDDFSQRPVVRGLLPWERGRDRDRPLTDADIVRLGEWLETDYRLRISPKTLFPLVDTRCREVSYHPVREYLDGRKWDEKERVAGRDNPGWLTTYFGVEDSPYTRLVGRLWLISAVARVRKPGCKVDTMLILEGPQGRLKSTGLGILGGDYFSDSLSDLGTKDSFGDLQGKWIIEMSELEAMGRSEATRTKHFMSKRIDYYRPPYGRLDVDVPRQCVFGGTTNADEYLKDWTGGRRFWPVVVGQILLDALRRDRDQIWAEADALYRAGEPHWVDDDDATAMCATEQEARRVPVPFEDDLAPLLEGRNAVTVTKVLDLLGIITPAERARVQGTVGKALRALNWTKARKQLDGVRGRFYTRPLRGDDDNGPTDEEILADLTPKSDEDDTDVFKAIESI